MIQMSLISIDMINAVVAVKGDEIIYPGVSAVHTNKHQVAHVSSPDAVSVCLPVGWSIQNGDQRNRETL